ncbi:MAG: HPP family protein [Betaproteobacteria bacterium]|nr:HPP family protein [Betaproteobacteria bacterium]
MPIPTAPTRKIVAGADTPVLGTLAALAFIAGLAALAGVTGISTVLFPEMGALSHDVLTRPRGTWARAPLALALTPVVTAMMGIVLARHFAFGVVPVLLSVGTTVAILQMFHSPIAPALSAGLLPLVLGVTTWWYPPAILLGTAGLALLAALRSTPYAPHAASEAPPATADDEAEAAASGWAWLPPFFAFLLLVTTLADATDWRLFLFPPLVVMAYEMFAHPAACPWAARLWALLLASTLSAVMGVTLVGMLGASVVAAVLTLGAGILLLRLLDLHVPPVLAIGLLPFVMPHPEWRLPFAVAGSMLVLIGSFSLTRRWFSGQTQ